MIFEGNSWVKINRRLTPQLLKERIFQAEILLADLDDTDAPSPAKKIARKILGWEIFKPKFLKWTFQAGWDFLRMGRRAESRVWESFLADFRQHSAFQKALREFTPELARHLSYPGVFEFYDSLSCRKVYVSRNLSEIIDAFAQAFGFSQFFAEQFDKKKTMSQIFQTYPEVKKFIVRGDSWEDAALVQFLEAKKRRGEIEDTVSICVCAHVGKAAFPADIETSQDQTLLSKILKETK